MVGNAASGKGGIFSIYFFPFFNKPLASIRRTCGNEDVPLKFYQEINSAITQSLVPLKLTGQLEKAPRESCRVQSASCFSAATVKQAQVAPACRDQRSVSTTIKKLGLYKFYDADKINER